LHEMARLASDLRKSVTICGSKSDSRAAGLAGAPERQRLPAIRMLVSP
jgi:hypothetical protein